MLLKDTWTFHLAMRILKQDHPKFGMSLWISCWKIKNDEAWFYLGHELFPEIVLSYILQHIRWSCRIICTLDNNDGKTISWPELLSYPCFCSIFKPKPNIRSWEMDMRSSVDLLTLYTESTMNTFFLFVFITLSLYLVYWQGMEQVCRLWYKQIWHLEWKRLNRKLFKDTVLVLYSF